MLEIEKNFTRHDSSAERADELFQEHRQEIFRNTDKLFARLLLFQWLAGILIAFSISPRTWAGQSNQIHIHVWAAIFLGGAISAFPIWMTRAWPGAVVTRYTIAVAQMLMSALLIGLTGGRIETHFHVFGSLVILSFYRDWRVLIPATIVIGLDHFIRGIYWPYSVYGVLSASPWRSLEHAGWVVFEDAFLLISCLRSVREMRSIANRTAALELSERSFRQIFEEAPIGMAVVGLDQRFQQVNARLCQMVGYSDQELTHRTKEDITFPEDVEEWRQLAKALLNGTTRYTSEKRFVHRSNEVLWVSRTACAIRDKEGKPRHYLLMMEDITQRKEAAAALQQAKEEAERANKAKSDFLSRMSHELRTPLNAILGFSQLLDRQSAASIQRERVGYIFRAGQHLLELINEVLDIARIEAGRIPLSLEPVRVSDALDEVVELLQPLAAERKIQIEKADSDDSDPSILADRQRLMQVLLNLLANAVKYNREAGRVVLAMEARSNARIRISITDEGPGIPAEKHSRLFAPFDRLGAERTSMQGTGLGLALSKRLTEAMGGTIGESQPARGASFWIEFPRVENPCDSLSRRSHDMNAITALDARVNTLLYIEDNLSNLTLIEHLLGEYPPLKLISAMQGLLGLELATRHQPDLILLDVHLPDISGAEVLTRLKAERATCTIPVVVLSADATKSQIDRLMAAGASDYLTKPLDVDRFFNVIERHLRELPSLTCAAK